MDNPSLRGLAFLFSLGGLGIACNGDDGDSATAGGTSSSESSTTQTSTGSSSTSTETTTVAATDATDTTDASGGATSTSDTGTTGSTNPTSSAGFLTTAGDTEGSTTGDPLPDQPLCTALGDKFVECYPRDAQYGEYYTMICNQFFADGAVDGPSCTAALEEVFACINNLECRDFGPELEMPTMCAAEFDAAALQCPSLE